MNYLTKSFIHDLRNICNTQAVYGVGLAATGSLGIASFITSAKSPKILHKPIRISYFNTKKIKKVASGFGFSLFASSSSLYGSGLNNFGQIGRQPLKNKNNLEFNDEWHISPKSIHLPTNCGNIIDISAGRLHSLIATKSAVYSFGDNSHGQCGHDPKMFPIVTYSKENELKTIEISNHSPIKQVHCAFDTSFILFENGELFSFGLGTDGQLGNDNTQTSWIPTQIKGDVKGEKIIQITGSTDTLLAISENGSLFAWGQNEYGQISSENNSSQIFYPQHLPISNVGKISCAATTGSSCIICNSNGDVFTWGAHVLGFGPKINEVKRPMCLSSELFASAVNDQGKVKKVFANHIMMGVVTQSNHLFTWGSNRYGNLGLGHIEHQYFPYEVFFPAAIKCVSFGPDHSLFVTK